MVNNEVQLMRLLPLLQQVLIKVGIHRTRTGSDLNLTTLQNAVLGAVSRKNNLTMSELSKDMLVMQSAATRIADDLVRKGLLKRANDTNDRRVTRLRLTSTGRDVLDKVRGESHMLLTRVLERMTPDEQEALIAGLEKFIRAVQATERDATLLCAPGEYAQCLNQHAMSGNKSR